MTEWHHSLQEISERILVEPAAGEYVFAKKIAEPCQLSSLAEEKLFLVAEISSRVSGTTQQSNPAASDK